MTGKNILLLLITLFSIHKASAQKLPSTLLWRISGNNLQKAAIQALAENKYTRIALYDSLQVYKRLKLFPSKYATQKSFAESIAFTADDDYDTDDILFITEKIIDIEGKKSIVYFFKSGFGEGDERNYFLSCAGPFSIKKKDISTKEAQGFIYDEDYFDESKIKDQMDILIQQIKNFAAYLKDHVIED